MPEVGFDLEFPEEFGGKQTITIESDPAWGKMQVLIKSSYTLDEHGKPQIDMIGFLDRLLETVILRSTGKFDIANRTEVKKLPSSVMTKLIGEVTSRVPLQVYLDNMGMVGKLLNPT